MTTAVLDDLWRVDYQGTIGTAEIFGHGMWVTATAGSTAAQVSAAADAGLAAFLAHVATPAGFATLNLIFATTVHWGQIVVRPYSSTTGLPTAAPSTFAVSHTGSGSTQLPPQVAWVLTLHNAVTIGRRRYNRFYLPPMSTTVVMAGGFMLSTLPAVLLAGFAAWQTAMAGSTPAVSAVYWSKTGLTLAGLTECRGDVIFDTQRRRRDQLFALPLTQAL